MVDYFTYINEIIMYWVNLLVYEFNVLKYQYFVIFSFLMLMMEK